MAKFDVAGMGNAIVDVIAGVDDKFLLDHAIAKNVMTLIDEFRAQELYAAFHSPREIAGGSAANTMAAIASLGGTGVFIGKVKRDRLGQSFSRSMKEIGIRYEVAFAESGASTACSLIAVTPDGHRSMNTFLGASREIARTDVSEDDVANAAVLYIEGYLWDSPEAKAAINKAIAAAKRAGRKVAFTLSDPFCVGRYREEFMALLRNDLDILFANEEEAKALFQMEDFDSVFQALRPWAGIAALTRSEKGCVVVEDEAVHVLDAVPTKVVDTTGAGDGFAAGFLFGHTHGKSLADCGRLGALAASEVISHYGARPEASLKKLAQIAGLG